MDISSNTQQQSYRLHNWDLLRSLCMLAVVIVHCGGYLGTLAGINAGAIAANAAILCDPIFFALSGYFAIRPLKRSLFSWYAHKVSTIILPLVVYSIILYLYTSNFFNISIHGYIAYFSQILSPWWFIPALIPFLIVAPFLNWLFEKLSDRQAIIVATAACALTMWGLVAYVLSWAFRSTGHETLALVVTSLQKIIPTTMIPGSGYFMYFCLGYFFRRLSPGTSNAMRQKVIFLGLFIWMSDVLCAYFGVDRFDPSFAWLFATIAILFIFNGIRIKSSSVQRVLEWTGRRSYSIYLLQYTAIAIVAPLVYNAHFIVSLVNNYALIRLLAWFGVVIGSYALSLAVASLIDATLLKLAQKAYEGVIERFSK